MTESPNGLPYYESDNGFGIPVTFGGSGIPLGGANSNPLNVLGSDLLAYWDADSRYWGTKGGITIATGVSSWLDGVGGYAAIQGAGSQQPVFSATSFDGRPGVTSDGIDDCLTCTDAALLATLPAGAVAGQMWSLIQNNDQISASFLDHLSIGGGSANDIRSLGRTSVNTCRFVVGTGAGNTQDSGVTFSGYKVLMGDTTGTNIMLNVDGASQSGGAAVPATVVNRVRLFARGVTTPSNFWNGTGAAFLVTKTLNAAKTAWLTNFLLNRR